MSFSSGSNSPTSFLFEDKELGALFSFEADLAEMIRFQAALVGALATEELIPGYHAQSIIAALKKFKPDEGLLHVGFSRDGVYVPELVKQVRECLGEDVRQNFHYGVTSQDLVDSSLMIRLKKCVEVAVKRLSELADSIASIEASSSDRQVLMARTRMQNALSISVREKTGNWRRRICGLIDQAPKQFPLQLGGPEGAARKFGESYVRVSEAMSTELGLSFPRHHWQTDRLPLHTIVRWFLDVANAMGKISVDVLIMTQNDVAEAVLEGVGGSSAMTHKKNPVSAEIILAQAKYCQAQIGGLNHAAIHENERSGSQWTLEWMVVPQLVIVAGSALSKTRTMSEQLRFTAG